MKKISIFGHKKPDTDSVTSAITLSYLKNSLGLNTEPRILGHPNNETKFVLNYFNIEEPKYLNDVKLQIKDVNYHKDYFVSEKVSIKEAYEFMQEKDALDITKWINIVSSVEFFSFDEQRKQWYLGKASVKGENRYGKAIYRSIVNGF